MAAQFWYTQYSDFAHQSILDLGEAGLAPKKHAIKKWKSTDGANDALTITGVVTPASAHRLQRLAK